MKRLRIDTWTTRSICHRSRVPCPFTRHHQIPICRRQSTQAAEISSPFDEDSIEPLQNPPNHQKLKAVQLPSPTVGAALKSAKLAALHARLSLPSRFPVQSLARTLVDRSADPDARFNNASFAMLGRDILSNYTSEHLICHYPRLPMDVLFAAVAAYVGPKALAVITKEWGVLPAAEPGGEVDPGYLQYAHIEESERQAAQNAENGWRRSRVGYSDEFGMKQRILRADEAQPDSTLEEASAQFVRALIGAMYMHTGKDITKQFFQSHFLSRTLNLASIFDFKYPTRDLSRLCLREGFEAPVARLESETGRLSRHPVFIVGVYSGRDKLGEGSGASLDEARIRASTAALKGWYLYSPMDVTCPSEVESGDDRKKWKPNMVDIGEVIT